VREGGRLAPSRGGVCSVPWMILRSAVRGGSAEVCVRSLLLRSVAFAREATPLDSEVALPWCHDALPFYRLVRELEAERAGDLAELRWYLERHVEVDGERHGPMTARLFERVCARDAATLAESLEVAARALARPSSLGAR